jgi:hypothetical protein
MQTPRHKDYVTKDNCAAEMTDVNEKSPEENEAANGTKTCPSIDHWLQEQYKVRANLYLPDLEDPILKHKIKSI